VKTKRELDCWIVLLLEKRREPANERGSVHASCNINHDNSYCLAADCDLPRHRP
jgi:hypothetical protein